MLDINSTLINIQHSLIGGNAANKDLEIDLHRLSQENNFYLTLEDKLAIKDYIQTQKARFKAIETYLD